MPIPETTTTESADRRVSTDALVLFGLAALLAGTIASTAGIGEHDVSQTQKHPATECSDDCMGSEGLTTRGILLNLEKATLIPVEVSETDRLSADTSLELTVEQEATSPEERYVITVSAVDGARGGMAQRDDDAYMGSFSFFAPPIPGQASTFVVGVPEQMRHLLAGDHIEIELRVEPVNPQRVLEKSRIRVLKARLIH